MKLRLSLNFGGNLSFTPRWRLMYVLREVALREELDVSWHERLPCHHCYHVMRKGGWGVVARPVLFAAGSYRGSVFCSRWHLVGPFSDNGSKTSSGLAGGASLQFSLLQSISPPCYQLNFHLPSTNIFLLPATNLPSGILEFCWLLPRVLFAWWQCPPDT